ncbi:serine/arginine-rich SC35-like splicing factor SCL30A [Musa acuminata AAA Group]|uniref:serine/arginine-rich SC35-like splicing factor SCL30A n=1 Tax=Musa acuminata AAA Group TaxID=214697 RepID=UPI0031DAC677
MHRRESTANDGDQPHGDDFQRSEEAVRPRDGNERRVDPSTPPPSLTSPHEQSRSEEYDEHYGDLNISEDFNRSEEAVGIRDGNVRRTDPSTVPPTPPPGNERLGSPSRGAGSAGGSEETGGLLDEGGEQSGDTSLLVGELHWWTTDADLEAELCKYGRVKEIKFDVWDNGKSNGMCIVDFYDPMAAAACRDGMNGHVFNNRPCVVEWAPPPIVPRTLALPAQPRGSGGGDGSMLPCPRVAAAPPRPAAAPPPPAAAPVNLLRLLLHLPHLRLLFLLLLL